MYVNWIFMPAKISVSNKLFFIFLYKILYISSKTISNINYWTTYIYYFWNEKPGPYPCLIHLLSAMFLLLCKLMFKMLYACLLIQGIFNTRTLQPHFSHWDINVKLNTILVRSTKQHEQWINHYPKYVNRKQLAYSAS